MKILPQLSITLIAILLCSGCAKGQLAGEKNENILIVYLTRTKNTLAVAQMIQKNTGGKLVELELEKPYPDNYRAHVEQVVKENEENFLPPIKTKIEDLATYNKIFIGFPTWGMKIPPPIKTFLKQYDLSGKTIIPFNTNAGYGIGSSFETVKQLCPKSTVLEGYSTTGGMERDGILFVMQGEKEVRTQTEVRNWLKKIKLIK